jgi:hypothetical protein
MPVSFERHFRIGGLSIRLSFEGIEPESVREFLDYVEPFASAAEGPDLAVRLRRIRRGSGAPPGEALARAVWATFHRFPFEAHPADLFILRMRTLRAFLGAPEVRETLDEAEARGFGAVYLAPSERGPVVVFPLEGRGEVFLAGRGGALESAHLTSVLFQVLSAALACRGGLLVHGSGIVRGGAAYAFVGLSGAGKSTVGRLSEGALLSDDGLILRRTDEGFRAYAAPFCQQRDGEPWKAGVAAGSAPLGGLFFLEKAAEHRLEPVPGPEAALKILQHFVHYYRLLPDEAATSAFRTVEALVKSCPVKTLHFRKDAEFWDVIPADACGA